MKHFLLLLVLLGGAPLAGRAQSSRVGLKAGGSYTRFSGRDAGSASAIFGFNAGIIIHLPVSPVFSVQPEILFSQKGTDQLTYLISGNAYTGRQRMNYLEAPIAAKFRSSGGFFFEAGPQFGLLLGAHATVKNQVGQEVELPNQANFKRFDAGYLLGIGVQTDAGFLLGLRYNGGFTAIPALGTYAGAPAGDAQVRNSAWQLYAGFIFFGNKAADPFAN